MATLNDPSFYPAFLARFKDEYMEMEEEVRNKDTEEVYEGTDINIDIKKQLEPSEINSADYVYDRWKVLEGEMGRGQMTRAELVFFVARSVEEAIDDWEDAGVFSFEDEASSDDWEEEPAG